MTARPVGLRALLSIVVVGLASSLLLAPAVAGSDPRVQATADPASATTNPAGWAAGLGQPFAAGIGSPAFGRSIAPRMAKADWRVSEVLSTDVTRGPVSAAATARTLGLSGVASAVRVIVETSGAGDPGRVASAIPGVTVERAAGNLVQVLATPAQIRALLAAPDVRYVRPSLPHTVDTVADEGVASMNAATWQARGQGGAGVRVAVIDAGFGGYAAAQAAGDLPASVTTVDYCEGQLDAGTVHGTAVAEIVHKMAPAAQLYLICIGTDVDLAAAEQYAVDNGIQIVSHSMAWFNSSRGDGSGEPGSPDAVVADAQAHGILWVNAAGNAAQAHWSGTFRDDGNGFELFAASKSTNTFTVAAGAGTCAVLKWDDWPASAQDYDLYVIRVSDGAYLLSDNVQDGSQPPTEGICFANDGPTQSFAVAIERYSASLAPRFDLFLTSGSLAYQVQGGSVAEPASAPAALAVGAACWRGTAIEAFSSRGPTIDGRIKPDLTGPDQVSSAVYGPAGTSCASQAGFAGTSAATPHVAGAAALVKGANPAFTAADITTYLETNTQDLGTAGKDSTFGFGLLRLPTVPFAPGAPTGAAGVAYNTSARISWVAPTATNGSAIMLYTVTSSPEGKTCEWSAGPLSCVVGGLANGTPYTFTVTATNAVGPGRAAAPTSPVTPLPVPDAPTGVAAVRGDMETTVTWTAPADNGTPITTYTVMSSPDARTCSWTTGPLSCTVTALTNGTPYTFTVTATNGTGEGPGSIASTAVTPAGLPDAPTITTVVGTDGAAVVTWSAPADNGSPVIAYTVTSSPDARTCSWTTGPLSCTVTGLTNGSPYAFTVTATNGVGEGEASVPSATVTPGAPPTAMIASVPSLLATNTVPVHWSSTPGTAAVSSYDVRFRRAAWSGSYGVYGTWLSATVATGATFTGQPGYTYCISARARDALGYLSPWTGETCTSVPLDDRSLARSGSWTAATGGSYYRSTVLRSYSSGSALVRTNVVARQVALLATTCRTCGSVKVYWGKTLLRTVSLVSTRTTYRKVISVAIFTSAHSGTLTIKVSSSGRAVLIDGVVIRR